MFFASSILLWAISLAASASILRSYFGFGASSWPHFAVHAISDYSVIVITALVSNLVVSYGVHVSVLHLKDFALRHFANVLSLPSVV